MHSLECREEDYKEEWVSPLVLQSSDPPESGLGVLEDLTGMRLMFSEAWRFYALFEASNTEPCMRAPAVPDKCVIMLSITDVSKTFKQVKIHKAARPDCLPGRILAYIFNLSLT